VKFEQNIISLIQRRPLLFKLYFFCRLHVGNEMTPPPGLNFVGYPEFRKIGTKYLEYIKDFTGLQPHHAVLDVGCGIGRTAIPMTQYLSFDGRYEGFDIVDLGITWCKRKISRKYPNFRFVKADIYNRHYNPSGKIHSNDYVFPYRDGTFDVVYATSVFTHMMPDAVVRYIAEMRRVLKPGGKSLCTFFILDRESIEAMKDSMFNFRSVDNQTYRVMNADDPENAIAFEVANVRSFYQNAGMSVVEPIRFGTWSGRDHALVGGQDMVIAKKA